MKPSLECADVDLEFLFRIYLFWDANDGSNDNFDCVVEVKPEIIYEKFPGVRFTYRRGG